MRTATSIASIMLSGLAMPFPRAVEAVPWSTETAGQEERQPTVTLTPDSPVQRFAASLYVKPTVLDRDVALVVIHGDDDIKFAAARTREQGVGGQRTDHAQALGARGLDGGHDRRLLLVAEEPVLARVRVQSRHRDARVATAEAEASSRARAGSSSARARASPIRHAAQRHVRGDVDHAQLSAHQQHRVVGVCSTAARGSRL